MPLHKQPVLENERFVLYPLQDEDFDELYAAASDPEIWEQHPNKDRWKKDVFRVFFEGAMQSRGAFRIVDKSTGKTIGSTRIYDEDDATGSAFVGYTFYAKQYWGKGINPIIKALMLDYLFQSVSVVRFHIGAGNLRSQIAITRLGAIKVAEQEVSYFGEAPKLNYEYQIRKEDWLKRNVGQDPARKD